MEVEGHKGAPIGNRHSLKWTPEQDAALTKHRADGYSGSQSAAFLNSEFNTVFSRNAIIGRLHRLGLTERTAPRMRILTPRLPKETGAPRRRAPRPVLPAEIIQLHCAEIIPRHVGLMDLEPGDCRYPYGDNAITFCGHPKQEGASYCTGHYHLCRGLGTFSERIATKISNRMVAA